MSLLLLAAEVSSFSPGAVGVGSSYGLLLTGIIWQTKQYLAERKAAESERAGRVQDAKDCEERLLRALAAKDAEHTKQIEALSAANERHAEQHSRTENWFMSQSEIGRGA